MIEDIEKIMTELAGDSNTIIVNPETLEELRSAGVPFDTVPAPTIDQLFDQRKQNAFLKIGQLPSLPQGLPPAVQALYQEIRECIFFGLNGATITMSAILIEFVLKHTVFIKEAGGYQKANAQDWDQFENMELGQAINRAKRTGVLDAKMAKRLHSFRETIRNPYSHYNIKKITSGVVARKVKQVDTKTGAVAEVDMAAKDHPMIQAQVKPWVDEYNVLSVFAFADEVVKYLLSQIQT
ncbi:MAG: hypothetical protein RDU59_00095 [Thermodesulfobacteriota bacterium]|nr:hypothetical protein [Thermodesulfobacteriota bacterium]